MTLYFVAIWDNQVPFSRIQFIRIKTDSLATIIAYRDKLLAEIRLKTPNYKLYYKILATFPDSEEV